MLKFIDFESGAGAIRFVSENPVFKGSMLILLSLIAFSSVAVMLRNGRKRDLNFWIFFTAAALIFIYGLFILIARPLWWQPPV